MINTAADAKRVRQRGKFPPLGERSWGPTGRRRSPASPTETIFERGQRGDSHARDDRDQDRDGQPRRDRGSARDRRLFVGPSDLSIALTDGKELDPHSIRRGGASTRSSRRPQRPARSPASIAPTPNARSRWPSAAYVSSRSAAISVSCAPARRAQLKALKGLTLDARLRAQPRRAPSPTSASTSAHRPASDHAIAALDQPGRFARAPWRLRPPRPRRHHVDHHLERERDEIADVRTDRRLPLESAAGEAAIVHQAPATKCARPRSGCGAGAAPARAPGRARTARGPAMLGEQRAQHLRFLAVEHAAARRALAALRDRHDHAVQRLDVLLGRLPCG